MIGIYFSAHWCPPCRGFTPELVKTYNELKAAGKNFEVVFVSWDKDENSFKEYYSEMPWLALPFVERDLSKDLGAALEVNGIPTLCLYKPDGTQITKDGRTCVSYGAEFFPWGPEERTRGDAAAEEKAARKKEEAIKAETAGIEEQKAKGAIVVKRLRGAPGTALEQDVKEHTAKFNSFATLGAPESLVTSGVMYYEMEVLEQGSVPQIGFATPNFTFCDDNTGEGVGDDAESWGLDGVRSCAWHDGPKKWEGGVWAIGDVIGFAVNVDEGKIATSKNGDWTAPSCGVVFAHDKIKAGVYACLTATAYKVRYNLDGSTHGDFRHTPPPESVWAGSAQA